MQTYHEQVFFSGRVPLFTEWRDFYDRCFGPYLNLFSLKDAEADLRTVADFKTYLISCMDPHVQEQVRTVTDKDELGYNEHTGRLGALFSDVLYDGFVDVGFSPESGVDNGAGI